MKRPWIRLYTDLPYNPKVQRLPGELFKFWTNVLCLSSEDGSCPAVADISYAVRLRPSQVRGLLKKLVLAELIDPSTGATEASQKRARCEKYRLALLEGREISDSDALEIHAFDERQFESDLSNERVKRHREKKRNVTSNVTETPPEQSRTEHITEQSISDQNARASSASRGANGTPTPPGLVVIPAAINDRMFHETIGAFMSLGVAVSETDMRKCGMLWVSLDEPAKRAAHSYAGIQAKGDWGRREETFVPRPWNYLRDRAWERKAVAKARDRPMSKQEAAFTTAAEEFLKERA